MASASKVEKNVVLIGKSGCGKSTVGNSIIGRDVFDVSSTSSGGNVGVQSRTCCIVNEVVRVFDTIGLFDPNNMANRDAMKKIKEKAVKEAQDGITLVLFIFRKSRFTPEERTTFDFIIDRFGEDIKSHSALIITYCESDTEREREKIIQDFKTNDKTKDVAAFMKKGIFTVGFPDEAATIPAIYDLMKDNIETDREKIKQLILNSHTQILSEKLYQPTFWDRCIIL